MVREGFAFGFNISENSTTTSMRRPCCSPEHAALGVLQVVSVHLKSWTSLSVPHLVLFSSSERRGRNPPAEGSALHIVYIYISIHGYVRL